MIREGLRRAVQEQRLRELDYHFAATLSAIAEGAPPELWLAAALVSAATGEGHVCLDLRQVAGRAVLGDAEWLAPPLGVWRAALQASGAVGAPGSPLPLILDGRDRLYLGRYFEFEASVVRQLKGRATPVEIDFERAREGLDRLFPAGSDPFQRQAAAIALLQRVAVISGGPGTGKTTTVTRLLALLVEQSWPRVPRIALAAPTGKAAARLTESIRARKGQLACDEGVRGAIVEEAWTLHRLLGVIPGESGFRHHAGNRLHLELLVLDEASMVDLPMMARLLEALPDHARLILLGDRDQLASVEAGSVLGDLCNRGAEPRYSGTMQASLARLGSLAGGGPGSDAPHFDDSIAILSRSFRFGGESGIGALARAVNGGDGAAALALCTGGRFADLAWREVDERSLAGWVGEMAVQLFRGYLACASPEEALQEFNTFRFLCALRQGPFGVERVNRLVEEALRGAGLLRGRERHYAGRPVLVTRNDYTLRLFNGDVGLLWPDPAAGGRLRAFFTTPDGGLRKVLPGRLPEHETLFAMTVHKSQGSEFDRCLLLLPDVESPVVTRELIYTGITRARQRVEVWGHRGEFEAAVARRIERSSGLRDALWCA